MQKVFFFFLVFLKRCKMSVSIANISTECSDCYCCYFLLQWTKVH
jgi:DNA phosphorothioation-dependent restriction protein DptG